MNRVNATVPENQVLVDKLWSFMETNKLRPMQVCEMLYGRDEKGHVKGSGQFYPLLKGKQRPSAGTVKLMESKLAINLSGVSVGKSGEKAAPRAMTPARAAVAAFEASGASQQPTLEPPRRNLPQQLLLSIAQDGRAHLALNLVDIPAEEALRCINVLTSAGLLKGAS
jgi:uncharacterized ferritin-like protein (DUF455 family)